VALAKAVGYVSAGTVEFIVGPDHDFYFLEMNTRLQVEHPVTELVTGIDLVEVMIRIAAGETLGIRQEDVRMDGWAVEARVYAEDPFREFLPSTGRLTRYRPPTSEKNGTAEIRIDGGVVEGSEISLFYDPMIAKLCTHAPGRSAAVDAMADALDAFTIDGIRHNIPFLAALMAHPRWREGRLSTAFIAEEFPEGFRGATPSAAEQRVLAAVAISAERIAARRPKGAEVPEIPAEWVISLGRDQRAVRLAEVRPGCFDLAFGKSKKMRVETDWRPGARVWRGTVAGEPVVAQIERVGSAFRVSRRGASVIASLMTPRTAELAAMMPEKKEADTSKALLCPMPGLVVSIAVAEGQAVAPGEVLATVEAMKMENVLCADRRATVARILAKPGDSLAVDAIIMEFA